MPEDHNLYIPMQSPIYPICKEIRPDPPACLRISKFALLAGGLPIVSVQQFLPINDRVGEKGTGTPDTFA